MNEYPAWRYHRSLPAKIVQTAKEDAALGPDWADTPAAFSHESPEPEPAITEPTPAPSRRGRGPGWHR